MRSWCAGWRPTTPGEPHPSLKHGVLGGLCTLRRAVDRVLLDLGKGLACQAEVQVCEGKSHVPMFRLKASGNGCPHGACTTHALMAYLWFPCQSAGTGSRAQPAVCRPCAQLLTANPSLAVTDLPGCMGSAECAPDP